MVYVPRIMRRYRYPRRRSYRRRFRRAFKRYGARRNFARSVARIARRVSGGSEWKYLDDYVTEGSQSTTLLSWNYSSAFCQISKGDEKYNREGEEVFSHGIKYGFNFWNNSSTNVIVRMMLVQPRENWDWSIESGPVGCLLFETNGRAYGVDTYSEANRLQVPISKKRWRVYIDKKFTLQSNSGADATRNVARSGYVKTRCKLSWDPYESSTKPRKPFYFVFITSQADTDTSTGSSVELSWYVRHYFKE